MRLVQFHQEATRYADIEAAATWVFHAAEFLEPLGSIEIIRTADDQGGWFIKCFDRKGTAVGLLSNV